MVCKRRPSKKVEVNEWQRKARSAGERRAAGCAIAKVVVKESEYAGLASVRRVLRVRGGSSSHSHGVCGRGESEHLNLPRALLQAQAGIGMILRQ